MDDYEVTLRYIPKDEVIDLLDLIERGQFDAFDLNTWRARVSHHEPTIKGPSFTPNWNIGARR